MKTFIKIFEQFTKGLITIIAFFPPHVFLSFEGYAMTAVVAGVLTIIGVSIILYSNIFNIDKISPLTIKSQESPQPVHQQSPRYITYSILNMVIRCTLNAIVAFACVIFAMLILAIIV